MTVSFDDSTTTELIYLVLELTHPCSPDPKLNGTVWDTGNTVTYGSYDIVLGETLTVTFSGITNNNCDYSMSFYDPQSLHSTTEMALSTTVSPEFTYTDTDEFYFDS